MYPRLDIAECSDTASQVFSMLKRAAATLDELQRCHGVVAMELDNHGRLNYLSETPPARRH